MTVHHSGWQRRDHGESIAIQPYGHHSIFLAVGGANRNRYVYGEVSSPHLAENSTKSLAFGFRESKDTASSQALIESDDSDVPLAASTWRLKWIFVP